MTTETSMFTAITPENRAAHDPRGSTGLGPVGKARRSSQFARPIAKAVTWRLIGTAEIFAISFWTTGHIATAGHTAGIAAISSVVMYVAHELVWSRHEGRGGILGSRAPQIETGHEPAVAEMEPWLKRVRGRFLASIRNSSRVPYISGLVPEYPAKNVMVHRIRRAD